MSNIANISQRQLTKQYTQVTNEIRDAGYYAPELDDDTRLNNIWAQIVSSGKLVYFDPNYNYSKVLEPNHHLIKWFQSRADQSNINERGETFAEKFYTQGEKVKRPPILLKLKGGTTVPVVGHGRSAGFKLVSERGQSCPSPAIIIDCTGMTEDEIIKFGAPLAWASNPENEDAPAHETEADIGHQLTCYMDILKIDSNHPVHSMTQDEKEKLCEQWLIKNKYVCRGNDSATKKKRSRIKNAVLGIGVAMSLPIPESHEYHQEWFSLFGIEFNEGNEEKVYKIAVAPTHEVDLKKRLLGKFLGNHDNIGRTKNTWAIFRTGATLDGRSGVCSDGGSNTSIDKVVKQKKAWLKFLTTLNRNPKARYAHFPLVNKFMFVPCISHNKDNYEAYEWNDDAEEFVKKQKTS